MLALAALAVIPPIAPSLDNDPDRKLSPKDIFIHHESGITEAQARAAVEAQGGKPVAAHLIEFVFEDHTATIDDGNIGPWLRGQLNGPIWAVEIANPPPAESAVPGGRLPATPARRSHTYNVKFVDATTGAVVAGVSGTLPD